MSEQERDEALYNQQKDWEKEQEFYASESAGAEADIKTQEESEMARVERELREKIDSLINQSMPKLHSFWGTVRDEGKIKLRDQIIALFKEALPSLAKEAGWQPPDNKR